MNHTQIFVDAVSLIAPSKENTQPLAKSLATASFATFPEGWKPSPESIPPRAHRRYSPQTLLAIQAAEDIAPALPENAAWVFGSAYGEGETLQLILEALRGPTMAIRPTRFQNSVHNAASGQWTIAQRIKTAATSICGANHTAGSSLLKALLQVQLEQRPVGVVLFDAPLPAPLDTSHRLTCPASAGLALSNNQSPQSIASIAFSLVQQAETAPQSSYAKEALATLNPVFSILPLFENVTGTATGKTVLGLNGRMNLNLEVTAL
ncbi:beta-ketoacyl synthase chain length factor [Pseudophaeobacter arcticus]|uniref:beta-ketoacyl synthase chain length factor n=1 Tax=Pseudophaeobacter arcticus TaxID=385492 RepID=UPI000402CC74|nr:beta-ketoacyl synthase chain length factor [Pseudophaeobacter arcticus]